MEDDGFSGCANECSGFVTFGHAILQPVQSLPQFRGLAWVCQFWSKPEREQRKWVGACLVRGRLREFTHPQP